MNNENMFPAHGGHGGGRRADSVKNLMAANVNSDWSCVYVCMYVCVFVYMYVCIYI